MKKKNFKKMSRFTLVTTLTLGTMIVPTLANGNEKNDWNSKETIQIVNSKTTSFNLNDWTYQDNGNEIVLSAYNGTAKQLVIPGEYNGQRVVLTNLSILPSNLNNLTIQEVNGQKVGLRNKTLEGVFSYNTNLYTVDLSGLDTSGVTSMAQMFKNSNISKVNLSGIDTSSVTTMEGMFENSSLYRAELGGWDVSNVLNMNRMFKGIDDFGFALDLTGWKLNSAVNTTEMFHDDDSAFGLIITNDPILKSYDYKSHNITGAGPIFTTTAYDAVNGIYVDGKFADGSSFISYGDYTVTIDSHDETYIRELLTKLIENTELPTFEGYKTLGYGKPYIAPGYTGLDKVYYTFEVMYTPRIEKIPDNQAPTIEAKDITINVGDTFNPLNYVTAEDPEEGELTLTEANVISNTVNPDVAGVYEVTYEVTDKEGEIATKTIQVTVNALPVIDVEDLIVLYVGDTFEPLDYVSVTDEEDGDFKREDIKVTFNDVDTSKPGEYYVTYEVEDSNGAVVSNMIMVIVEELLVEDEIIDQPTDEEPNQKPNEDVETEKPQPDNDTETEEKPTPETDNGTEEKDPSEEKNPSEGKEEIEAGASSGLLVLIGGFSLFQGVNLFTKRQKKN